MKVFSIDSIYFMNYRCNISSVWYIVGRLQIIELLKVVASDNMNILGTDELSCAVIRYFCCVLLLTGVFSFYFTWTISNGIEPSRKYAYL